MLINLSEEIEKKLFTFFNSNHRIVVNSVSEKLLGNVTDKTFNEVNDQILYDNKFDIENNIMKNEKH